MQGALVLLDRDIPAVTAGAVVADHYRGVREGVLDMLRVPDSRVAYIGGPEGIRASRERLQAYLDAHETLGRSPDDDLVRIGSDSEGVGREQAADLLANHQPTGFLAEGAQLSQGVLSAIRQSGLRIGTDVDLVAADGIPLLEFFDPPINTVERDAVAFGETAAELLIEMLDDASPRVVTLPTRYVRTRVGAHDERSFAQLSERRTLRYLTAEETAVCANDLAGDERRPVGEKELNDLGDLLRCVEPPQRMRLGPALNIKGTFCSGIPHHRSVDIPGATALTRMPRSAHSTARVLVIETTLDFATAYGIRPGQAKSIATELIFTIEPPAPCSIIAAATACAA